MSENPIYEETQKLVDQLQIAVQRPEKSPPYKSFAQSLMAEPPCLVTPTPDEIPLDDITLPEPTRFSSEMQDEGNTALAEFNPIGFELWEALAYDLALSHADPATIADEYRLTTAQLAHLQENEYFAKMLKAKQDEVAQLGTQAAEVAFTVKMRMLANRATPEFLKRLTHPSTSTKDFHNLFKLAVELAQLTPKQSDGEVDTPVIGASVVFNISGVPGLSHLQAAVRTDNITDAEFTDVTPIQTNKQHDDELGEL